ncbi:peptidylprolyl isomerase [Viridibacillus sp. YIM B01967]|jgi:foldase protein PrsA|uniref:Foldase protein PrsA n=1 Tax=Viridibacillus soli TaxID=2798301 RepID=A0ABS1H954_9BACL|nr:peptidylprolyl isomerase [Viridibacillus soli]MBK3495953.1 peptidylprolyl isomerase [Viridibacillus soli]
MKKTVLTLTLAASVLALAACGNNSSDEIVAESKAGDITKEQLYQEMKSSAGTQTLQTLVIKSVLADKYKVTDKEVEAEFKKQKDLMGESYEQTIATQGWTEKEFKENYIRILLLQEKAIDISDKDIEAYYERMKKEVKASHILVADEATAKEVKAKLNKGEDFAKLAKKYSTDPGSKEAGGELGWYGPDKMVAEFTDASYSLKKGEISEPIKTTHGYHIIKLEDTREVKDVASLKDSKDEIKQKLAGTEESQNKFMEKAKELIKAADVKIKDKDLKDALKQFLTDDTAEGKTEGK